MASKRDQLKKLKASRAQQTIEEMSSPAEDKLKELEKQEEAAEKQNESKKDEYLEHTETKENSEDEMKKANAPVAEATDFSKDILKSEEEKTVLKQDEKIQQEDNVSQKPEIDKIVPQVVESKEKTKRTSMALLAENNQFIRLRAMQLGYSIQNYVNLLIEEEIARNKEGNAMDLTKIADNLDMNYRRGQNSTIVALVLKESNAKFLKRGGAMLGMNATNFLNHIISEEQKREKENGPRKGEFDE
ncbi:MAG: hypothetical protein UHU19_18565 [Lachnospiraceae bacterium]|nr:hypothetical protein [Lachnospiraceae bacterium]